MEENHQAGVKIRRATRQDLPHIVRMLADDPLGQHRERFTDPLPQSYFDAFAEIDGNHIYELVVAELDGQVIGTLELMFLRDLTYQGGKRAQIEAVRVDASQRSQGVGQVLLEWAIARARAEQCHMVQLTTNKSRQAAQRFYQRLGFVASHEGMKLELSDK